jgi:hypothetical protein
MSFKKISASVTRPNDTTQYAANDVWANGTPAALSFTNVVNANDGSNKIVKAMLVDSASQATKGQFDLWLFHTAPALDADNAAFTPTDAELANVVGILRFDTGIDGDATSGAGGNAIYFGKTVNGFQELPIRTKVASRTLYGIVVVKNTYTPVAQEVLTFTLWID